MIHKDLQPYGTEFDSCICQVFFRHVTEHTALYFVINCTIPLLIVLFSFYYIYFLHVTKKDFHYKSYNVVMSRIFFALHEKALTLYKSYLPCYSTKRRKSTVVLFCVLSIHFDLFTEKYCFRVLYIDMQL